MRLRSVFKMFIRILNTAITEQMGCIIFFFFRLLLNLQIRILVIYMSDLEISKILYLENPSGLSTWTVSPTLAPIRAFPNGDSLEISPLRISDSCKWGNQSLYTNNSLSSFFHKGGSRFMKEKNHLFSATGIPSLFLIFGVLMLVVKAV